MRFTSTRLHAMVALSFCLAAITACGGSKQPAKDPTTTSAEAPRGGSTPVPETAKEAPAAPASSTAAASTKADGSDIIPPFPSAGSESKSEAKEAKAPKESKKAASATPKRKPKKKG